MNYYEIYLPDRREPVITNSVRRLRDLPDGTIIWRTMESERYEVPVKDGKAYISYKKTIEETCDETRIL